jgi:hypothetical protein
MGEDITSVTVCTLYLQLTNFNFTLGKRYSSEEARKLVMSVVCGRGRHTLKYSRTRVRSMLWQGQGVYILCRSEKTRLSKGRTHTLAAREVVVAVAGAEVVVAGAVMTSSRGAEAIRSFSSLCLSHAAYSHVMRDWCEPSLTKEHTIVKQLFRFHANASTSDLMYGFLNHSCVIHMDKLCLSSRRHCLSRLGVRSVTKSKGLSFNRKCVSFHSGGCCEIPCCSVT